VYEALNQGLRAHLKTPVRASKVDKRGVGMKETNVEYRPLHAHTPSFALAFEMRS
jgi:hypothetical protein